MTELEEVEISWISIGVELLSRGSLLNGGISPALVNLIPRL
jgi:hypothetical protein